MNIIEQTILGLRSEELTSFFKIFPFFVSESFYIGVIAIGYWIARNKRVFWQLGFLVPFSVIFNSILKHLFMLERPDLNLHLIKLVDKSSGFPSGDAHLGAVFWSMIMWTYPNLAIRFLSTIIIFLIMISRIYLGVHTVLQVAGGAFVGILTVWFFMQSKGRHLFKLWENGDVRTYWFISWASLLIYVVTATKILPIVFGLAGVLFGFGLCLNMSQDYMKIPVTWMRFFSLFLGLVLIWGVNLIFPKIHFEEAVWADSIFMAKYFLISIIMFAVIPYINIWLVRLKYKNTRTNIIPN